MNAQQQQQKQQQINSEIYLCYYVFLLWSEMADLFFYRKIEDEYEEGEE